MFELFALALVVENLFATENCFKFSNCFVAKSLGTDIATRFFCGKRQW